jgi:hypothetical protein
MRRSPLKNLTAMMAALLSGPLFMILAVPLGGQTAPESRAAQGFGPAYDVAHEITLTGVIREVVTKHEAGSPVGMHLLVSSSEGVVDTHVGPFLSKETKDALHIGTPVQIVGAKMQMRDKEYLLARELSLGGSTITIRNSRGFLLLPHGDRVVKIGTAAKSEANGGTR